MSFYEIRLLTGGTYTASTDWFPQFSASDVSPQCSQVGEISVAAVTYGVAASVGLHVFNPTTLRFYVEADATHPVQVQYMDLRAEYTSAGYQTIELQPGVFPLRFIRAVGPLTVMGLIFGPSVMPTSLYPSGSDPIQNALDGLSTGSNSASTSVEGLPIGS